MGQAGKQQKGQTNEPRKVYAHTDPQNPGKLPDQGANWQLLEEHLQNTANRAFWKFLSHLLYRRPYGK